MAVVGSDLGQFAGHWKILTTSWVNWHHWLLERYYLRVLPFYQKVLLEHQAVKDHLVGVLHTAEDHPVEVEALQIEVQEDLQVERGGLHTAEDHPVAEEALQIEVQEDLQVEVGGLQTAGGLQDAEEVLQIEDQEGL
jgi:hypothetical protein